MINVNLLSTEVAMRYPECALVIAKDTYAEIKSVYLDSRYEIVLFYSNVFDHYTIWVINHNVEKCFKIKPFETSSWQMAIQKFEHWRIKYA